MRKASLMTITEEIGKVLEKNLRVELLKEREAQLQKELESVQRQLNMLGTTAPKPKPIVPQKPRPASRTQRPVFRSRPIQKSARALIIETMKRTKRPMTVKELTRALLRRGFKSTRKRPRKTIDSALRNNPACFRKTAPSTFRLIK
ncbi:hypothetical protein CH330_02390 [candidate division WOR-3 bacterium JGI_Cruoil_03_51_56]|uniref:HTH HARE-type domain-containing protein n=1 Tax=candidate division WOR-3 bacterium JGI_Cruoil_03_51_56 TaxID=1973747 RepID=A0A235BWS0_UNCW3|nr:MAG: hypothetical protein CH330_02390 [candidate division WOR-3 bacterium JGI_Cruoil_03_51_56]